jgi:Lrp/AsnC family transcriptional regulator, leucine-responsive regulatory protein
MKFEMDQTDRDILRVLQEDCKSSLQDIGKVVGLSAPSVVERIRKLEDRGVIKGYHAVLDPRALGLDVAAFIGVSMNYPKGISAMEKRVLSLPEVLECHHVTGGSTLLIKVRTRDTDSLENLISRLRSIPGVERTETMVVLSTRAERTQLSLEVQSMSAKLPSAARVQ